MHAQQARGPSPATSSYPSGGSQHALAITVLFHQTRHWQDAELTLVVNGVTLGVADVLTDGGARAHPFPPPNISEHADGEHRRLGLRGVAVRERSR